MVSFQAALKQVLQRFAVASKASGTQAEIQRVYTGLGAEFGQRLTYDNITFAIKREPVAHRIVFAVAHDIFDNWFEVEPLEDARSYDTTIKRIKALKNEEYAKRLIQEILKSNIH